MIPDCENEVRELFCAALDCKAPVEMERLLDALCKDRPELRSRLEALLEAHRTCGNFMNCSDPSTARPKPYTWTGTIIDRFRILGLIGEGGFGVVYLAEQFEPVLRQVAFKVIRPGMDSGQIVARFQAERQALALMDHPNIAQIYDGGQTACGHPYVVMELVSGLPITEYCNAEHLSVRERLNLFLEVCRAVQHAHQKGVIHCDLKPSNIFVNKRDDQRVVKVIDFGIARALNPVAAMQVSEKSENASIQGSPNYMSPEQWPQSGLDVDTRSDIFSLGILIYELVTGVTPFERKDWASKKWTDLFNCYSAEKALPPSVHYSSRSADSQRRAEIRGCNCNKLNGMLREELDWIILKALEGDRELRYESVAALADDLQRHLADEVVRAVPVSMRYRLKKFNRRNRTILVSLTSIVLILIATTVFGFRAAVQAQRAENLANRRLIQEQLATARAEEASAAAIIAQEKAESQRQLAETNLQHARQVVGRISGQLARANTDAEVARLRQAILMDTLEFFQQFLRANSADLRLRTDIAQTLVEIGNVQQGLLAWEDAETSYRDALRVLEELCQSELGNNSNRWQLALARLALAGNLRMSGQKLLEAELLYRQSLAEFDLLEPNDVISPDELSFVIDSFAEFGHFLAFTLGRRMDAEPYLLRAATMSRDDLRKNPRPVGHVQLARVCNSLGILYRQSLQPERAAPLHRESIQLLENAMTTAMPDSAQNELARSYAHLALAIIATGNLEEAEAGLRRAIEIRSQRLRDFPKDRTARIELSLNQEQLAGVLQNAHRSGEAEAALREAMDLFDELSPGSPPDVSVGHHYLDVQRRLANLLHAQGRTREAVQLYERLKTHAITSAAAANQLAWHLTNCPVLEQRDYPQAIQWATTATQQNPTEGIYWGTLGCAQFRAGDLEGALRSLNQAQSLVADSNDSVPGFLLAMTRFKRGDIPEAKRDYDQACTRFHKQVTWMPEDDQIAEEARELLQLHPESISKK